MTGDAGTPDRIAVDPAALENLRKFGGDALLRQLITLFRDQVDIRSGAMRAAVAAGDSAAARHAAHALKSSAGQVGAVGLQELCGQIEVAAIDDESADIATLVAELDRALPAVEQWLTDRGFPREA